MTVFENVRIIHFHPGSVSEPTDVAVEGGKIAAVGSGLAAKYPRADRDASGGYVSPGIVCSQIGRAHV